MTRRHLSSVGAGAIILAMALVAGRLRVLRSAGIPKGHEPEIVKEWRRYSHTSDTTKTSVVVFSDFKCEACKYAHEVLSTLLDDARQIFALRWHQFPILGPVSNEAARAILCVSDEDERARLTITFFAASDSLGVTPWTTLAARSRIENPERLQECVDAPDSPELTEARRLALDLGVVSTPTVLVDSMLFRGMPSRSYLTSYLRKAHGSALRTR